MVPEEDGPLQECQCAELPHQVGVVSVFGALCDKLSLLDTFHTSFHSFTTFSRFYSFNVLFNSPLVSIWLNFTSSSLHPPPLLQLEGWPSSVCTHPQTQTRPHRLLQAEEGSSLFPHFSVGLWSVRNEPSVESSQRLKLTHLVQNQHVRRTKPALKFYWCWRKRSSSSAAE